MTAPKINSMTQDAILQEIKRKAPFYTPQWRAEGEKDSGLALSKIFSHMSEIMINRLNKVPQKHFISFLDTLNFPLLSAQPARVPLTFKLSKGASENVLIPALSQASAQGPDGDLILFETEKNIIATSSKLIHIFSVIPNSDSISDHSISIDGVGPASLFNEKNIQEHIFYIGDENLFNIKSGIISIDMIGLDNNLVDHLITKKKYVTWEYSVEVTEKKNDKEVTKVEWHQFQKVESDGPKLIITKANRESIDKITLNEIKSRWIRCRVIVSRINKVKEIKISSLLVSISPDVTIAVSIKKVQGIGDVFYKRLTKSNNPEIINTVDELLTLTQEELAVKLDCSNIRALNILEAAKKTFFDKTGNIQSNDPTGIDPDLVYYNDVPVNPGMCYPFGKKPHIYDTFYIGCEDAFSKKGYTVRLHFNLLPGRPASQDNNISDSKTSQLNKPQLSWEYWDGEGWSSLEKFATFTESSKNLSEDINCDNTNGSVTEKQAVVTISDIPEIIPVKVNGKENYWIRIRLVGGDYGNEYRLIGNNQVEPGKFCPPKIKNLKIAYEIKPGKKGEKPEYILVRNNLVIRNYPDELEKNKSFKPFLPLSDQYPTLYFGFDKELKEGPISLFINIDELFEYPENFLPRIHWQYPDNEGWVELEVQDETRGFTKSEIIQFIISKKMKGTNLFGSKNNVYWIRAVVTEDFFIIPDRLTRMKYPHSLRMQMADINPEVSSLKECEKHFKFYNISFNNDDTRKLPPKVIGFYPNSTWAYQSRTITNEITGSSSGEPNQVFNLLNMPVININIHVKEPDSLSNKKDGWVKWTKVSDLFESVNTDRHFVIDKTTGTVEFGNGIYGMIPPKGLNNIKATYSAGGGRSGNVKDSNISKLHSAIAFVDKVYNPVSSDGGADTEEIDELLIRAPTVLKHRHRAVALEDFQWLAKEASMKVAMVKVLPNFNVEGNYQTGRVSVVIVPESTMSKPVPSSELKRRVETYLKDRCSNVMTLNVIPPSYIKIDVSAVLITKTIESKPVIEYEARKKIIEFLHPLTGGEDGNGWEFGSVPCISDIYSIFECINYVDYVKNVTVVLQAEESSKVVVLTDTSNIIKLPGYVLPFSGKHTITAQWEPEEETI
jgi:hypothetical protein